MFGVLVSLSILLGACSPDTSRTSGPSGDDDADDKQAVIDDPPEERIRLDDLEETMAQLSAELQAYSAEERQQALDAVRTELREVDARIDSLALQAQVRSQQLADQIERQRGDVLTEIRYKREQVSEWADRMSRGSDDAWHEIQTGFGEALLALGKAMEDAERGFESPPPDALTEEPTAQSSETETQSPTDGNPG
jgi:hypothetical protein